MSPREDRYAAAEQLKDSGDLAGAVAMLEVVVTDEPDFALAHSALAAWCTRLERHQEAVRHARRVVELEPRDPFSYTGWPDTRGGRCPRPLADAPGLTQASVNAAPIWQVTPAAPERQSTAHPGRPRVSPAARGRLARVAI